MDSIEKSVNMKEKQTEKTGLDPKFVFIIEHQKFPMELQLEIISYLPFAEFHICPMIEDLIYMWMKWEIYKIDKFRHEFLGILEKHQQKMNGKEIESQSYSREWYEAPFYTHDLWCGRSRGWLERDLPKMNRDERLQSFLRSYLGDRNSFQLLDFIFPNFEMELYPNTIQLIEVESESRDGFKIKYKIRGKNYSGMHRITINQLDVFINIVGTSTNMLKEDKFQVRFFPKIYDVKIIWTKVITGTREVYEHGWDRAPHIHPKDL